MLEGEAIVYASCQSLIRDGPREVLAVAAHDHNLPFFPVLRDSSKRAKWRFSSGLLPLVVALPQIDVVFIHWVKDCAFVIALDSNDLTLNRLILDLPLPLFSSLIHEGFQLLQVRLENNRIQQIVAIIHLIVKYLRIQGLLFSWGRRHEVASHFPVLANFYQLTLVLKIFSTGFGVCYEFGVTGYLVLLKWLPFFLHLSCWTFRLGCLWLFEFAAWMERVTWEILLFWGFSAFS